MKFLTDLTDLTDVCLLFVYRKGVREYMHASTFCIRQTIGK